MAVIDGTFIEYAVRLRNRFDEWQQLTWRLSGGRRRHCRDAHAEQEKTLNALMQCHRRVSRESRKSSQKWRLKRCPSCRRRSRRASRPFGQKAVIHRRLAKLQTAPAS